MVTVRVLPMDHDLDHARGTRTVVRVDPVTFAPTPWTDAFRERLAPYRADLPDHAPAGSPV